MDMTDVSLQEMFKPYKIAAMAARHVFHNEFEGLSSLFEFLQSEKQLPGFDIAMILKYCLCAFPYILSQGCGSMHGENFADSENAVITKEYTLLELWFRSQASAKLIYALQNLCVTLNIYPAICFKTMLECCKDLLGNIRLGSGIAMDSRDETMCANWAVSKPTFCPNPGTRQCGGCMLVSYCSFECRKDNWEYHKLVCGGTRSPPEAREAYASGTMNGAKPIDARETVGTGESVVAGESICMDAEKSVDASKMTDACTAGDIDAGESMSETTGQEREAAWTHMVLWDKVPAFGLLGDCPPSQAAGTKELPNPLRLCFDECFDLNNVVETICQMSGDYSGEVKLYINCTNPKAVARNVIICNLLMSLAEGQVDSSAVDAAIAVWYSAYLTPFQFLFVIETIRCILSQFQSLLPSESRSLFDRMFDRDDQNMGFIHKRVDDLAGIFDSTADAEGLLFHGHVGIKSRIRARLSGLHICKHLYTMQFLPWASMQLHPTRESSLQKFDSSARVDEFRVGSHAAALARFRHSGVLLPFGQFSGHHTLPNPTLFQAIPTSHAAWIAEANALDPLSGWNMEKVLKSTEVLHNVPANDIYGRLYFYVRDLLMTAVKRMKRIPMTFVFSDKSTPLFVHDLRHKSPGILSIYRAMVNYPSIGKDPTQWNLPQFLRSWAPVFTRRGDESLIIRHVADSTGAQWNDTADWEMALDDFDVFISRFSQMDESAHYLRKYRAALKDAGADMNRLSPLFLNDVTHLRKCYQELEQEVMVTMNGEPQESSSPLALPGLRRRTEHLTSPCKPASVVVGLTVVDKGTGVDDAAPQSAVTDSKKALRRKSKLKAGSKGTASTSAQGEATAAEGSSSFNWKTGLLVTNAQEFYRAALLSMVDHLTIFSEWRPAEDTN